MGLIHTESCGMFVCVIVLLLVPQGVHAVCNPSLFEGVDYDCCTVSTIPNAASPTECSFLCSSVGGATHFSCKFLPGTAQSLNSPCTGGCECKSGKANFVPGGALSGIVNSDCTSAPTNSPSTHIPTSTPSLSPTISPTMSPIESPRLSLFNNTITKTNANGDFFWSLVLPSSHIVTAISHDSNGNVLAAGSLNGLVALVTKYASADGALIWERRLHTTSNTMHDRGFRSVAHATSIVINDEDNDLFVSGTSLWAASAYYNPSMSMDNSARFSDGFIMRIDTSTGGTKWFRQMGNISNDASVDLSDGGLQWHGTCDDESPSCAALKERWCCPDKIDSALFFHPVPVYTDAPTSSPTQFPTLSPTSSPSCVADANSDLCMDARNCCHEDPYTRGLVRQTCQTLCCALTCEGDDSGSGSDSDYSGME